MKNDDFNVLMEQFKNLSNCSNVVLSGRVIMFVFSFIVICLPSASGVNVIFTIGKMYNKQINLLYNKEIDDLNFSYTEDDYIEALYAYTYILENAIVQLLDEN